MDAMGLFAQEFGYTPDQYRAMKLRDRNGLMQYLADRQRRAEFQAAAAEHFSRARR
jgi:hypothetical protein